MRTKRAMMVALFFGADAAWEAAGAFWGFSILALLVLWIGMSLMAVNPSNPTAVKVSDVEARLNEHITATGPAVSLVSNGGTIGGDLHVQGDLYGTGGVLTVGDTAQFTASGNGPTGGNTFLGLTNTQASFLATLSQSGGVTPPTTTWGGGAGCGSTPFNANALSGLNQLEDAINQIISALAASNILD